MAVRICDRVLGRPAVRGLSGLRLRDGAEVTSNRGSVLNWEQLRDDLNARLCPYCESPLRSWTYQGDLGISGFGKREAPIDFECAADPFHHNWREWIEVPR